MESGWLRQATLSDHVSNPWALTRWADLGCGFPPPHLREILDSLTHEQCWLRCFPLRWILTQSQSPCQSPGSPRPRSLCRSESLPVAAAPAGRWSLRVHPDWTTL